MDSLDLKMLLVSIYAELEIGSFLSDLSSQKLLEICLFKHKNNDFFNLQEFANIFAFILQKNPILYSSKPEIITIIELSINNRKVTFNILNSYKLIIQLEKYKNSVETMNSLVSLY